MKKGIVLLVAIMCVTFSIYTIFSSKDSLSEADEFSQEIILKGNGETVNIGDEAFIYEDKLYAPVSTVIKVIGGQGFWDKGKRELTIRNYKGMPECNPSNGEVFAYGFITGINFETREIEIEQYMDDNSVEVPSKLKVEENVIILFGRNKKMMNLELEDIRAGDKVGIILNKDKTIKEMVLYQ